MIIPEVSIIVAIAENYAIGKENKLLWHIPDDLKRFKRLTTGHRLIMGRRTFLSLPNGPLPNRINTVISDTPGEVFPGCEMVYSIDEAKSLCQGGNETFIIGGGMVYKQFLPLAARLYLTRVWQSFEADTFFPELNMEEWTEFYREDFGMQEGSLKHSFHIYTRKVGQE